MPSDLRDQHRFVVLKMLQISIDDSRTEPTQGPMLVMAGYAAPVAVYEDFADDWQNLLKEPRALEYLKGEEATGRRKQFKGWTIDERDKRVLRFVELIKKYQHRAIKTGIRFDDYQAVIAQNRGRWRTPTYFAFVSIIIGALSYLRESPERETVEFFFDSDIVPKQELKDAYKILVKLLDSADAELFESEPTFCDDKKFMPLQAADLYAWHVARVASDRDKGIDYDTSIWRALQAVGEPLDCSFNRQDMLEIMAAMTSPWPRHLPKLRR